MGVQASCFLLLNLFGLACIFLTILTLRVGILSLPPHLLQLPLHPGDMKLLERLSHPPLFVQLDPSLLKLLDGWLMGLLVTNQILKQVLQIRHGLPGIITGIIVTFPLD